MLIAEDLRDEIIESMKGNIKEWLDPDEPSLTDHQLTESNKYRCEFDGDVLLMNLNKINGLKLIEELGETIKRYIKENIEITYTCTGTWYRTSSTGLIPTPDPLIETDQVKIISYNKKLQGYFKNLNEMNRKIAEMINTAEIEIKSDDREWYLPFNPLLVVPDNSFLEVENDRFDPISINWVPTDSYEGNMYNLAKGIIAGVKSAVSTKLCTGTHTVLTVPPVVESTITCKMLKIA